MKGFAQTVRDAITLDEPWALVEKFATLVRDSGTEDERVAAQYISDRLAAFGVKHTVHEPLLYISLPTKARLVADLPAGAREINVRPAAMSLSTDGQELRGELVYVPTQQAKDITDIFGGAGDITQDVAGKIIITEGIPFPGKVAQFQEYGVRAIIFIAPGSSIHEAICTQVWGAPDLYNVDLQPKMPVLALNKADGATLIEALRAGSVTVTMQTWLDTRWRKIPVIESVIQGTEEPDKFVLLHGHLDSWYVGIGDNATGDATMLEVARVLQANRDQLKRSVRICWWSGHSHGRYAGSTWYADTFALDLNANCIAHLNCDSPGCRDAIAYDSIMWMPEAEEVARTSIEDVVGVTPKGVRPLRAGDISFNNLGVSTFFMLLSSMPEEMLKAKDLYAVGGCGGNNEWHSPLDTIEVADKDILLNDMKIYATAVARVVNTTVIPLDYRRTVDDLVAHLQQYDRAANGRVSFEHALAAAGEVKATLNLLYAKAEKLTTDGVDVSHPTARQINEALLRVGRHLVSAGFSESGKFRQDPALGIPPVPAVAPALRLAGMAANSHMANVICTHVTRGLNMVTFALREANREARAVLEKL